MIEESSHKPNHGVMTAVCRTNKDSWDTTIQLLEFDKSYNVHYGIIGH